MYIRTYVHIIQSKYENCSLSQSIIVSIMHKLNKPNALHYVQLRMLILISSIFHDSTDNQTTSNDSQEL